MYFADKSHICVCFLLLLKRIESHPLTQALRAETMIFFSSSVISGAYFLIAKEVHPLIFLISPLT